MWARPALAEIEHAVDVRGHADHGAGLAGDEGTGGHVYRIGPAEDGGYYLLGATSAHAGLFADIAWSTDTVAATTRVRAASLGLEMVELATWYDVDDAASLDRLLAELRAVPSHTSLRPHAAPATHAALSRLGLLAPDQPRASA